MTWEEVCDTVINYYREYESEFDDVIQELDSYTGILGENGYCPNSSMESINDIYHNDAVSALQAAMAGGDESYQMFDTDRDYFYTDDTGALFSTDDEWPPDADYTDLLDEEFVKQLYEYREDISLDYTIEEVFDAWAQQEGDS